MGFGLEHLMLRLIRDAEKQAMRYVGRLIATDRNSPASTHYAEAGFLRCTDTEWTMEASSVWLEAPSWFDIIHAASAR
jgi:hypothetical protein